MATLVGHVSGSVTNSTSKSVTLTGVTSGNTLVGAVSGEFTQSWLSSLADDKSNSYTQDGITHTAHSFGGLGGTCALYHAAAGSSGNTVVTATLTTSASNQTLCVFASEWSGLDSTTLRSTPLTATGGNTPPATGNFATASQTGDLVVAIIEDCHQNYTPNSGYTLLDSQTPNLWNALIYKIVVTGGTENAGMTTNSNYNWAAVGDIIAASGGGGGGNTYTQASVGIGF